MLHIIDGNLTALFCGHFDALSLSTAISSLLTLDNSKVGHGGGSIRDLTK